MTDNKLRATDSAVERTAAPDPRRDQLERWTRQVLGRSDLRIAPASADASFRRYFRASGGSSSVDGGAQQTWIIMDAPPDKEDVRPFIKVAAMLVGAGVNAPRVIAQSLEDGFLLLSDLGSNTFLTELTHHLQSDERVDSLYQDAIDALVRMQVHCKAAQNLPAYDAPLLRREMDLFPDWLLGKHLALTLSAEERRALNAGFECLIESALSQPRIFVHRDYHSRNLMVAGTNILGPNPGVLDFQDAVCGPVTYDLVSLLRDCYIAWPTERVHRWLGDYRQLAVRSGVDVGSSQQQLLRWFDLMGIQRHLKAIGIFARLWHRDGKSGYLGDIPRTLGYIRAVAPAYDELAGLGALIENRVCPALARL